MRKLFLIICVLISNIIYAQDIVVDTISTKGYDQVNTWNPIHGNWITKTTPNNTGSISVIEIGAPPIYDSGIILGGPGILSHYLSPAVHIPCEYTFDEIRTIKGKTLTIRLCIRHEDEIKILPKRIEDLN